MRRAFLGIVPTALGGLALAGRQARAQPPGRTAAPAADAAVLPIADTHIHYSHDAWEVVPVDTVVALMRTARLRLALVSSSDDEGTQRLAQAAPDLVIPSLRPYRSRGDIATWVRDPAITAHLEARLRRHRYAALGEFHLFGADADLPVPRRMVDLAREHALVLHAHSDTEAVERLFAHWPQARILWAHAGFERPDQVRAAMRRHPRLWADLAFRNDPGSGGRVDAGWREAFDEFPSRFMLGTDTFTPERLHYIPEHAAWARGWLADLPSGLAENLAWRNAHALLTPVWEASQARPGMAADGDGMVWRLEAGGVTVTVSASRPPRVSRPWSLMIAAETERPQAVVEIVDVDAQMPTHRHGMNYRPRLTALGPGRARADALMLHMPGPWRLRIGLRVDGSPVSVQHDFIVP